MSEDLIIQHCSPTLAGLKTGSLFSCTCPSQTELAAEVRQMNHWMVPKGLCVLLLCQKGERALIYLYRPERLQRDLSGRAACAMLKRMGYPCADVARCVTVLAKRLRTSETFPHEIGLFLGYPPEDVWGFIKYQGKACKCVGCWKVYGDAEQAQKCFAQYKKCTDVYARQWRRGTSLNRLTVSV